jgi:DNA-binding FadR family transcriptional regulator
MPLSAVTARSVSDQVFEQLLAGILGGQFRPGEQLPAERELVTTFRISRHGVRQALKRLEHIGLVRAGRGGGTEVLDFKRHAGLDLLALFSNYAMTGDMAMSTWLAVHEMRTALAADVARLCAIRGSPEIKSRLLSIAERMKSLEAGPELFPLELEFWDVALEGANNLAYRLAFNSLVRGVTGSQTRELASAASEREVCHAEYRIPLARAIAAGDAEAAAITTTNSMRGIAHLLAPFLPAEPAPAAPARRQRPARTSKKPSRARKAR